MFDYMDKFGITVCYSPDEPTAGSDGAPPAGGNDGAGADGDKTPQSSEDTSANNGILSQEAKPEEKSNEDIQKDSDGQKPEDKANASEKEPETDQEAKPFTFDLSEGHEEFKDDFAALADDMNAWLKDNPDATSQQVLQQAASLQADAILQQREDFIKQQNSQIEKWDQELKSDQKLGGVDFDKNMEIAKLARDKLGGEDLKELLGKTGLGSHPALVRIFHLAGTQLQNAPVLTGAGASDGITFAEALYGGSGKT